MNNFNVIRTMLFTPANHPERFEKAKDMSADGVVIDLEDAISQAEKDAARESAINYFITSSSIPNFMRCLRINSLKTRHGLKDLSAIIDCGITPDAIVLPKTEYAAEILILDSLLGQKKIPYIALIETSTGLYNAQAIAQASNNMAALVFGGGDLAADLGATLSWEPMLAARSLIVQAAATAGLAVIDVPYLNLREADDTGILEETRKVKALGYTGKFAIHPKHIKPILEVYTPSPDEVVRAQKIIDIFNHAKGNVCEVDGKMIDAPIVRLAQRTLALMKK